MTKQEFFKKNDSKFLSLGFKKDEQDPMFFYQFDFISEEEIEDSGLTDDDIPKLLYGNTGINKGFCVYTGEHFIWTSFTEPLEAIEWSKRIVSFESV